MEKQYIVEGNLSHDSRQYKSGDIVVLNDSDAQGLLAIGRIKEATPTQPEQPQQQEPAQPQQPPAPAAPQQSAPAQQQPVTPTQPEQSRAGQPSAEEIAKAAAEVE